MTPPAEHTPRLLGPWRRTFQWLTTLLILLLPWIQVEGNSLLRIDLETLTLHLFGQQLRIEELYFVLFFSLVLILLFLLVTLVLGRVWCGWACPQTTLSDIAEWLARKLGLQVSGRQLHGATWRKFLAHILYAALALLVGANLVWYFIEPQRFLTGLLEGHLQRGAWISMLTVAVTVYVDLAFVRRIMCSEFCPYGRFQTTLVDPGTLTLLIPAEEQDRCIECGACVRSCPMEIDIRRGYQVECINCGRCLDACRKVMVRRQQDGLIHYRFGTEGRGAKALIHPRTLLLTLALLVLGTILTVAVYQRAEASLKVAVSHTAASRLLASGEQVTFFSAWISNRSAEPMRVELTAVLPASQQPLELKGQTQQLTLAGGQNRRYDFALVTPRRNERIDVEFLLRDVEGTLQARQNATVLPLADGTTYER